MRATACLTFIAGVVVGSFTALVLTVEFGSIGCPSIPPQPLPCPRVTLSPAPPPLAPGLPSQPVEALQPHPQPPAAQQQQQQQPPPLVMPLAAAGLPPPSPPAIGRSQGTPIRWAELSQRISDMQAKVSKAGEACRTLQERGDWHPQAIPPVSVQQAQRLLGRQITEYQQWRQSVRIEDPVSAPSGLSLPQPRFKPVEFGCQSQNTEDGILVYIFALIGFTNRHVVEMCAGVGWENNAIQLVLHHGFKAYLVDGNAGNTVEARRFFSQANWPADAPQPVFDNKFITKSAINGMIAAAGPGFAGEIDLLSLDMDGVDYWILQHITQITPRVVVVEYQELWGPNDAKTRPYSDSFVASTIPEMGASLPAFQKLLVSKGYRLVGCHSGGYNAFFVKNGIADVELPAYPIEGCFVHHKDPGWASEIAKRRAEAQKFIWVDV